MGNAPSVNAAPASEKKLGEGFFGAVYSGTYNGTPVALKVLKGTYNPEALLEEAKVMAQLNHPNIVKFFGVKRDPWTIVMELMDESLLNVLRRKAPNEALQINIAKQVATGMDYVHSKKLIHRDLAARNVLIRTEVNGSISAKITDFGLTRLVSYDVYVTESGIFPIKWTAPEAYGGHSYFVLKSDVWSFGILFMEIVTGGRDPYPDIRNDEVVRKVIGEGYRMPKPSTCSSKLYDIMKKCWLITPSERPDFKSVISMLS